MGVLTEVHPSEVLGLSAIALPCTSTTAASSASSRASRCISAVYTGLQASRATLKQRTPILQNLLSVWLVQNYHCHQAPLDCSAVLCSR